MNLLKSFSNAEIKKIIQIQAWFRYWKILKEIKWAREEFVKCFDKIENNSKDPGKKVIWVKPKTFCLPQISKNHQNEKQNWPESEKENTIKIIKRLEKSLEEIYKKIELRKKEIINQYIVK